MEATYVKKLFQSVFDCSCSTSCLSVNVFLQFFVQLFFQFYFILEFLFTCFLSKRCTRMYKIVSRHNSCYMLTHLSYHIYNESNEFDIYSINFFFFWKMEKNWSSWHGNWLITNICCVFHSRIWNFELSLWWTCIFGLNLLRQLLLI